MSMDKIAKQKMQDTHHEFEKIQNSPLQFLKILLQSLTEMDQRYQLLALEPGTWKTLHWVAHSHAPPYFCMSPAMLDQDVTILNQYYKFTYLACGDPTYSDLSTSSLYVCDYSSRLCLSWSSAHKLHQYRCLHL